MIETVADAEIGLANKAIHRLFGWKEKIRSLTKARSERRCLFLKETISLGEKRLLAVVEFCGTRILVGATATSITLLETAEWASKNTASSLEVTEE